MSLKRRLNNLEGRSSRKPASPSSDEIERSIRRKLNLPLPKRATSGEAKQLIELLREASQRLKADASDTAGFDAVRSFAESIHQKYRAE